MAERPYAEDVNYWQTSQKSPDALLQKAADLVTGAGGRVFTQGFIRDAVHGAAYLLAFEIDGAAHKALWPVLPSRTGKDLAANRQAATALYHDVKAKCVAATFVGARVAFAGWRALPDGRAFAELADEEISEVAGMFGCSDRPQLAAGQDDHA